MKDKAVEFYTQHRRNCAQSVALAWSEAQERTVEAVEQFAACGHGKAPEGLCGALFAACKLATPAADRIKQRFAQITEGRLTCKEIRASRVLRCVDCVSHAASLLEAERAVHD
jgi:hypothetical protein